MKIQACACGLLLMAALTANAGERLTIAVSPLQSFAPTTLVVRIHVAPDVDNRALEVTAESGEYFRSSLIQLDGKEAPRTIAVELRGLPGGDYQVPPHGFNFDATPAFMWDPSDFTRQELRFDERSGDHERPCPRRGERQRARPWRKKRGPGLSRALRALQGTISDR